MPELPQWGEVVPPPCSQQTSLRTRNPEQSDKKVKVAGVASLVWPRACHLCTPQDSLELPEFLSFLSLVIWPFLGPSKLFSEPSREFPVAWIFQVGLCC